MARMYMDHADKKSTADIARKLDPTGGKNLQSKGKPGETALSGGGDFFGRETLNQLGASHSMPGAVRAKMEGALGADFSGVKLYESPVVAQGGAEAAASGSKVAFAPGKMDFSSAAGLELLGHELSHVASQAKGEVAGHGFINDSSLERKADLDGKKAASFSAFDSASSRTLTPMSAGMGSGMPAAGPVQARKAKNRGDLMRQDAEKKPDSKLGLQMMAATPGAKDVQKLNVMLDYLRAREAYRFKGGEPDASETAAYQQMINEMTPEAAQTLYGQEWLQAGRVMNTGKGGNGMSDGEAAYRAKYSEQADQLRAYQSLVNDLGNSKNHAAARAYYQERNDYNRKGINGNMINAYEMIQQDDSQNAWARKNSEAASRIEGDCFRRQIAHRHNRDKRMDEQLYASQHPIMAFFKKKFGK